MQADYKSDTIALRKLHLVFDRLDEWRHCSGYQLERRADVFFSLYLPEVLQAKLGFPMREEVIPEFPISIKAILDGHENAHNYRADFLTLSEDTTTAVFVELKTDSRSRRTKQDEYLKAACGDRLRAILQALIDGFQTAAQVRKHYCMLQHVADLGMIEIPPLFREHMMRKHLQGAKALSKEMQVKHVPSRNRVVYIQPHTSSANSEEDTISFTRFAEIVEKHDDPLSQRFLSSLRKWSDELPGSLLFRTQACETD